MKKEEKKMRHKNKITHDLKRLATLYSLQDKFFEIFREQLLLAGEMRELAKQEFNKVSEDIEEALNGNGDK